MMPLMHFRRTGCSTRSQCSWCCERTRVPKRRSIRGQALGQISRRYAALRQSILAGTLGPQGTPAEYPPGFDPTAVFLARILVPATAGASGNPPSWNLTGFSNSSIDNTTRLFVIPPSILARWNGLGSGTES